MEKSAFIECDFSRSTWTGQVEGTQVLFENCNFEDANLSGADLSLGKFESSNLKGCDLSGANLGFTDLSSSNLEGANLKGAFLIDTRLPESVEATVANGIHIVANRAKSIDLSVTIEGENGHRVDINIYTAKRLKFQYPFELKVRDNNESWIRIDPIGRSSMAQALLVVAWTHRGYKVIIKSVKTKYSKVPIEGKMLKELALNAWLDVFGFYEAPEKASF